MLSVDDALAIARAIAAQAGEDLEPRDQVIAIAVERLLVELEIARAETDHYRAQLQIWGIPAKRWVARKIENGGFEYGWE